MPFSRRLFSVLGGGSLLIAVAAAWLVPTAVAGSAKQITVDSTNVVHTFGGQMVFTLTAHAPSEITGATLLLRTSADSRTDVLPAEFGVGTKIEAHAVRDLQAQPIPPFAHIAYSWRLTDSNGDTFNTPEQVYLYDDNRFQWQVADRGPVHTHWYSGDLAFGQSVADVGYEALTRASRLMNTTPPDNLDIYIYETVEQLQSGLSLGGRAWVGGHADPSLGVVMAYATPDQFELVRLENDLSHELAHVMVYQIVGSGYNNMPVWLDEGIATTAELQPDPVYTDALNTAVKNEALLQLDSLCSTFSVDASRSILSYAQSASIVRYIQDRWGPAKIRDLLNAYHDGASCQGGVQRELNLSLAELQTAWESDVLRANPLNNLVRQLLPYLFIFGPVTLILSLLIFVPRRNSEGKRLPAVTTPAREQPAR